MDGRGPLHKEEGGEEGVAFSTDTHTHTSLVKELQAQWPLGAFSWDPHSKKKACPRRRAPFGSHFLSKLLPPITDPLVRCCKAVLPDFFFL